MGSHRDVPRIACVHQVPAAAKRVEGWILLAFIVLSAWAPRAAAQETPARTAAELAAACERQDFEACLELAGKYEDGDGVAADPLRAVAIFVDTCEKGHAKACMLAGYVYGDATYVPRDIPRGLELLERGCDGGEVYACSFIYQWLTDGKHIKQDPKRAFTAAQKGCALSEANCNIAGSAYLNGQGVKKNKDLAMVHYQRACDAGNNSACTNLAHTLKNEAERVALYERTCRQDIAAACVGLGIVLTNGHGPEDHTRGMELLRRYCDQKNAQGCYNVAVAFNNGDVVKKDHHQALAYYQRSCELGYKQGCTRAEQKRNEITSPNPLAPLIDNVLGQLAQEVAAKNPEAAMRLAELSQKVAGGTPPSAGVSLAPGVSAGSDGAPVSGKYLLEGSGIVADVVIEATTVTMTETGRRSVYGLASPGEYHSTHPSGIKYGLRLHGDGSISAFKPGRPDAPTRLVPVGGAVAQVVSAGNQQYLDAARRYAELAKTSNDPHLWSACAGAAFSRANNTTEQWRAYALQAAQTVKLILDKTTASSPCPEAIPQDIWAQAK